jgi:molybdopterin converting factor subunit 1
MNRYTILLFARLKELADTSAVEIDLDEGAKVADLRRKLGEQVPALAPLLKHCLFAVNDAYADESLVIPTNAEIACTPPVSGG